MPSLPTLIQYLSVAGPVAAGVLLIRLWIEGLIRRYRWFAFYLFLLLCEVSVLLLIPRDRSIYFIAYLVVDAVIWVTQTLVVLELFSLVMAKYPGIRQSGRWFIWFACAAALCAGLALSFIVGETAKYQYDAIAKYLVISRVIGFTLLAFLLMILGFLLYFPIPLSRNVVVYNVGFAVYFASRALTRLAGSLMGPDLLESLSVAAMSVVLACLLMWIVLLNRRGEQVDLTVGHRWNPDQASLAVRQLDSLNATLLKAGRK